jgi:hypothetical protein
MISIQDASQLPPFLRSTEMLEPEDIPLQVALLTMEVAQLRLSLSRLAALLMTAGQETDPPQLPAEFGIDAEVKNA